MSYLISAPKREQERFMTVEQSNLQSKIDVLIADPHQVVHKGLAECINLHPKMRVVGLTTDGNVAFKLIKTVSPDVVVLDVRLNGLSGIELIKKQYASLDDSKSQRPKFLVFTTYFDKQYIWSYLAAGAQGYILKDEPLENVVKGIEALANNQTILSQNVQGELINLISSIKHGLTKREMKITELVAKGFSNQEIATQINLSEGTVQVHLQKIYRKIPLVENRAEIVAWAWINRIVR